jgi:hypothetical protein
MFEGYRSPITQAKRGTFVIGSGKCAGGAHYPAQPSGVIIDREWLGAVLIVAEHSTVALLR